MARYRSIERRSVVCQGEANASRSVRWRCVTEEAPRVKEVVTPASESRHVTEHQIGRRACGGTAGGDEQGGAAGAAALIPVPHLRDEQRRACDVGKSLLRAPTTETEKALKRRVFDVFFINGFVNGQDCLAKNTVNDHGQIAGEWVGSSYAVVAVSNVWRLGLKP